MPLETNLGKSVKNRTWYLILCDHHFRIPKGSGVIINSGFPRLFVTRDMPCVCCFSVSSVGHGTGYCPGFLPYPGWVSFDLLLRDGPALLIGSLCHFVTTGYRKIMTKSQSEMTLTTNATTTTTTTTTNNNKQPPWKWSAVLVRVRS